jgi:SagB-type dehydrogenase family enzyme
VVNENVEVARGYHERTKHSEERLRANPHHLDWDNRPVPFKLYRDLETIPLPRRLEPGTVSALRAISALAGQETEPAEQVPGLQALARVLYYSAGITKIKRSPGRDVYFRAAPNTGALYHVDLYLACRDLPDLSAGVYHFGAHDFALRRLRVGDYRGAFIEAAGGEPSLAQAPVVVASASTYWRNAWKYRERAYRHAFWDAGTLHANLLAVAAAEGLAAKVVAGFADRDVEHLLGLDPAREGALALVPLGRTAEPPVPAPDAPALNLETEPLSPSEIDYPAIRQIHRASSLEHGQGARWRGVLVRRPEPDSRSELVPLRPLAQADWPAEPLESVILRRGSTRRFEVSRSLTFEELSTALAVATASIPADFSEDAESSLLDLYLIAHAIEGLPPGAYYLRRAEHALELLKQGEFRAIAGRLGLFQELPAAAAANVYCLADLEPILARFGNRGYRAAQLEGGIIGGRLYLAAYALRFGATGLTFLDDEVTEFFSPHAKGKSVIFLTALGRAHASFNAHIAGPPSNSPTSPAPRKH